MLSSQDFGCQCTTRVSFTPNYGPQQEEGGMEKTEIAVTKRECDQWWMYLPPGIKAWDRWLSGWCCWLWGNGRGIYSWAPKSASYNKIGAWPCLWAKQNQGLDKKLYSKNSFKTGQWPLMFTQVTASENVENKNYECPINPSEIAPDTKPTSPSAEGTQVMG